VPNSKDDGKYFLEIPDVLWADPANTISLVAEAGGRLVAVFLRIGYKAKSLWSLHQSVLMISQRTILYGFET
jgi:hypothetical protein